MHSFIKIVLIGSVMVSGANCGNSQDAQGDQKRADANAYLDVARCWGNGNGIERIKGAVALYDTMGGTQAVVFTGECDVSSDHEGLLLAFSVRAQCITGIPAVGPCSAKRNAPIFDERIFIPGARPEFPSAVYAFVGRVTGASNSANGIIIEDLKIDRYQMIPREMYGLLLESSSRRRMLVDEYLNNKYFTAEGYRILR